MTQQTQNDFLQHFAYNCPGLGPESRLDVRATNIGPLLQAQQIIIPLFQRRYCWTEKQLRQWILDLRKNVRHGLGKATFKTMHGEFICIDGQQRITTSLLFLSSIHDKVSSLPPSPNTERLLTVLRSYLYTDTEQYLAWLEEAKSSSDISTVLQGGLKLPFSRLVPSYLDRLPFFQALMGQSLGLVEVEENSHQLFTKAFFDNWLKKRSLENLAVLTQSLLTKFYVMKIDVLTPINMAQVFLWMQEKTLAGMGALLHNPAPGVDFGVSDLVRNLILSTAMDRSLDEQEMHYEEAWLRRFELRFGSELEKFIFDFVGSLPPVDPEKSVILKSLAAGKKQGVVNEKRLVSLETYATFCYYAETNGIDEIVNDMLGFAERLETEPLEVLHRRPSVEPKLQTALEDQVME